jgi:D-alanyl-D-alanine carboxypeptidase
MRIRNPSLVFKLVSRKGIPMTSVSALSRFGLLLFFVSAVFIGPAAEARYSALVIEADTGEVLYECNANDYRHPASLTKMMTLYMVFDALGRRRLSLHQPLWVSEYAASRPPTKLGLRPGETVTVQEVIYGMVTQSANDAATVVAEALGGSEFEFARQMTQKARLLGMTQTYFRNASGLPDPYQITTAWDMYKLAQALRRDFPQYYPYFSVTDFYFRNRIHRNHNHLLENYEGTDGIKTGYTRGSGYNLVTSVNRSGHRLIGVVFGGNSAAARDAHMRAILDQGLAKLDGGMPVVVDTPPSFIAGFQDKQSEEPVEEPVTRAKVSEPSRPIKLAQYTEFTKPIIQTKSAKSTRSVSSIKQTRQAKRSQSTQSAKQPKLATRTKANSAQLRLATRTKANSAKSVKIAKLSNPSEPVKPVKQAKPIKPVETAKSVKQQSKRVETPKSTIKSAKPAKPAKSAKSVKQAVWVSR